MPNATTSSPARTPSSPPTSGTPPAPSISTNTWGAAESSSATNATPTSVTAKPAASRRIRPNTPHDAAATPRYAAYGSQGGSRSLPTMQPIGYATRVQVMRLTSMSQPPLRLITGWTEIG